MRRSGVVGRHSGQAEDAGDQAAAEHGYADVLTTDPDFRDAAARYDTCRSTSRDSSAPAPRSEPTRFGARHQRTSTSGTDSVFGNEVMELHHGNVVGHPLAWLVALIFVSDEPGLFDIPSEPTPEAVQEMPIRPEQVQQIREAFHKAGMAEQEERKTLINSIVIRDVTSLRELHAVEVRRILAAIEQRSAAQTKSKGSAWDDREEDTWIDKL